MSSPADNWVTITKLNLLKKSVGDAIYTNGHIWVKMFVIAYTMTVKRLTVFPCDQNIQSFFYWVCETYIVHHSNSTELHYVPSICVAHRPALFTTVHKGDLCLWEVGVTLYIFSFLVVQIGTSARTQNHGDESPVHVMQLPVQHQSHIWVQKPTLPCQSI